MKYVAASGVLSVVVVVVDGVTVASVVVGISVDLIVDEVPSIKIIYISLNITDKYSAE